MAREDREARERLKAEAYMDELRRQYMELVEAERAIFAINDGKDIVISDDEGGNAGGEVGGNDEIDVKEWWSVFPDDDDDGTGPDPALVDGHLTREDWVDLHFDGK